MNESQVVDILIKDFSKIMKVDGLKLSNFHHNLNNCDLIIDLKYGKNKFSLACEIKSVVRSITIENALKQLELCIKSSNYIPCLIVPYLPKFFRNFCKQRNISYIDLSGNISLNVPGSLYVERDGQQNKYKETTKTTGPFSDKKSLILRYLFAHPNSYVGVREIATECNINPGGVSLTLYLLENLGYISRNSQGKGRLINWRALLDDWAFSYKSKKQREFSFYWHKNSLPEMIKAISKSESARRELALTVHAGASLIAPHTNYQGLHAYIMNEDYVNDLRSSLNLIPTEKGANVFLWIPYYRHSVLYGSRVVDRVKIVSDIQLYLDLKRFPVRGEEQAEYLFRKVIEPKMEKKDSA